MRLLTRQRVDEQAEPPEQARLMRLVIAVAVDAGSVEETLEEVLPKPGGSGTLLDVREAGAASA